MAQRREWSGTLGPWTDLQDMMNRLFEEFSGAPGVAQGLGPRIELRGDEDGFYLLAALPGLKREDVTLSIEGRTLSIHAERDPWELPEGATPIRRERSAGTLRRAIQLPEHVDNSQVKATMRDGLLEVKLPLPEPQKPREINIDVEEGS